MSVIQYMQYTLLLRRISLYLIDNYTVCFQFRLGLTVGVSHVCFKEQNYVEVDLHGLCQSATVAESHSTLQSLQLCHGVRLQAEIYLQQLRRPTRSLVSQWRLAGLAVPQGCTDEEHLQSPLCAWRAGPARTTCKQSCKRCRPQRCLRSGRVFEPAPEA